MFSVEHILSYVLLYFREDPLVCGNILFNDVMKIVMYELSFDFVQEKFEKQKALY